MSKPKRRPKGFPLRVTRASVEFDKILDEVGPIARAIRARFHRTELWRLRTGRRVARLDTANAVKEITKGRIPSHWWLEEPRKRAA